jgi:CRP-like cAMP-binding protein
MATLDEIAKEKQRITQALARVEAQRERLADQLNELEATERVLARYSQGPQGRRAASGKAATAATRAAAAPQSRGRRRGTAAKPGNRDPGSPSLGDQILALANGKTQQEIAATCKGVRPNHIGIAIARHKRAGRIEERDGKLYTTHSTGIERHSAV